MQTKQTIVFSKDTLNAFGRKNAGKRQAFSKEKRIDHFLKTATATSTRLWYIRGHEKTLLDFHDRCRQGGASKIWPREGKNLNTNFGTDRFSNINRRVNADRARPLYLDSAIRV
jgi:hypothetical protein